MDSTSREDFFKELFELYKKYNISLGHEDPHGAFIIEDYNEYNIDWIYLAIDDTTKGDN
jgi:hypothetical protein